MQEAFTDLLAASLGKDVALKAAAALEDAPAVSVRTNPFKPADLDFEKESPVPWSSDAFFLPSRPSFTLDPLFHAGAYYVQDSSAMFVGEVFRMALGELPAGDGAPMRILDLCAAPGGKTTDLLSSCAKLLGNDYLLVANEISRQRATALCDNTARWGELPIAVTSADPAAFGVHLEGYFDIMVADVPCSGEGMFRKDPAAVRQWSVDNVALCQARQRRIISDAWPSLKEGGILVYSTCTFNHCENDDNVSWIAENLGAELLTLPLDYPGIIRTACGWALVPGFVRGEGQYCAVLRKISAQRQLKRPSQKKSRMMLHSVTPEWFTPESQASVVCKDDMLVALSPVLLEDWSLLQGLRPLRTGVAVGNMKGKDMVPHPDLALARCLSHEAFAPLDVPKETALDFLHKEAISAGEAMLGYLVVRYKGLALGFVKNLGRRCNNLLAPGRRIRMDV